MKIFRQIIAGTALLGIAGCVSAEPPRIVGPAPNIGQSLARTHIGSLSELTVENLRKRSYGSTIEIVEDLSESPEAGRYAKHFFEEKKSYDSVMASYGSEGLRLYARIDIPTSPPPPNGYPVIMFAHGWVGAEAAPTYHFSFDPDSIYSEVLDSYAKAGFVVVTPGFRGHGTVNNIPAGGLESMKAWDNASYLSPIFYAVDLLNLVDGLDSLPRAVRSYGVRESERFEVNLNKIMMSGHSQGGDVALIALAISGEGSQVRNSLRAGSISAGTFAPRLEQLAQYGPMASSREAFLSGDGSWTGTATGRDGSVNPHFVFGWPSDGIETPQPDQWTWQNANWSTKSVPTIQRERLEELYSVLRNQVGDLADLVIEPTIGANGNFAATQESSLTASLAEMGAYHLERYLSEPLNLHISDQDYYSTEEWNRPLCGRINASGGRCVLHIYHSNTHGIDISKHTWFSPPGTARGKPVMIQQDILLFSAS
jgi:dienelactone hydrolase